jgi:hypothetical protein
VPGIGLATIVRLPESEARTIVDVARDCGADGRTHHGPRGLGAMLANAIPSVFARRC